MRIIQNKDGVELLANLQQLRRIRDVEGQRGGKDKGIDYGPLKEYIKMKVKSIILLGEAKDKIKFQWTLRST